MIKGQNIFLSYGKKANPIPVLKGISFEIKKGSLAAFIGKAEPVKRLFSDALEGSPMGIKVQSIMQEKN